MIDEDVSFGPLRSPPGIEHEKSLIPLPRLLSKIIFWIVARPLSYSKFSARPNFSIE
jgi:hypothetical protein